MHAQRPPVEGLVARLQRRPFDDPVEIRRFPNGHVDVVELDDVVVGRFVLEPGWRWSTDVGPVAGTATCQYHHVGVVVSGEMVTRMEDGTEIRVGPNDAFEIPPGHDAWVVGDEPWVAIDFAGSRTFARRPGERDERILASIVFTDIVASTELAARIGDRAWRDLVAEHNAVAAREIDRFRGRAIKTTGDGILALFDGAERAVRCAAAIGDAVRSLDLAIRAGVHTGEVEFAGGDVRGVAVHVAARILALAGPGEVLVSGTTYELVADSGLVFEDAGSHELKGITGKRSVFRLGDPPGS
jgi:class 3 adenylate cyclase